MTTDLTYETAELARSVTRLEIHDHACMFYQQQQQLLAVAVSFVRAGLAANDKCIFFGPDEIADQLGQTLQQAGDDVESLIESGQLILKVNPKSFLYGEHFDANCMVNTLDDIVSQAQSEGFRSLRTIGQIDWHHSVELSDEQYFQYESQVNRLYHSRRCLGICQYYMPEFSASVIERIMHSHPLVISNGRICRNPHYITADENISGKSTDELMAEIDTWPCILSEDNDSADHLQNVIAELSAIHANSPVAMMLIDSNWQVVKVNDRAAQLAGRPSMDLTGLRGGAVLNCLNHLQSDQGCGATEKCRDCRLRKMVVDTMETATSHDNVETWLRCMDDNGHQVMRCLLICTSLLRLGNRNRVLLCLQDITDIKLGEERLLAAERRYRTILAASPMAVFLVRDRKYIFANTAAADTLGYKDPAELIGTPIETAIDRAQMQSVEERLEMVADGKKNPPMVLAMLKKNGEKIITESVSVPIQLMDGPAVLVMAQDITERIDALRALDESEQRFRSILEAVDLYAVILDREGKINFANPYLCKATGWSARELKQKNWFETLLPESQRKDIKTFFDSSLQSGEMLSHKEGQVLAKDGNQRLVAWNNVILRDISGKITGTASLGRDITDHRRLEQQYMQAQKMEAVGRLAAGVAHDFNNQLTVIQGYCEMLMYGNGPSDPSWKALTEIYNASQRAHSTTSHLLSFSRRQILHPEPIYINELLKTIRGPISKMVGEDIRLTLIAEPGIPAVMVDAASMHQALMNLIVNARDAMPEGGELILRSETVEITPSSDNARPGVAPGSYVVVEVADTGTGMSAETAEKLFEPFYTTKEVGKGTGLGLPMVEGFVRQSNGHITVDSEPGKGTAFRIWLPTCRNSISDAKQETHANTEPGTGGGEGILLVEDDQSVREMMAHSLTMAGYNIFEAARPSEAISIMADHASEIQLMVSDIVMPEISGKELAGELLAGHADLKVIFITGYSSETPEQLGHPLLQKPFSGEKLAVIVQQQLDQRCSSDTD